MELRIARQELFARDDEPLQVWSVLDEAALRRQIGGADWAANGWKKSSRSQAQSGGVEVTTAIPGMGRVRDTKLGPASPILAVTATGWTALLAATKNGEFKL